MSIIIEKAIKILIIVFWIGILITIFFCPNALTAEFSAPNWHQRTIVKTFNWQELFRQTLQNMSSQVVLWFFLQHENQQKEFIDDQHQTIREILENEQIEQEFLLLHHRYHKQLKYLYNTGFVGLFGLLVNILMILNLWDRIQIIRANSYWQGIEIFIFINFLTITVFPFFVIYAITSQSLQDKCNRLYTKVSELKVKGEFSHLITILIQEKNLLDHQVGELLQVDETTIANLLEEKLEDFSIDQLFHFYHLIDNPTK